jgi:hypothetical protein
MHASDISSLVEAEIGRIVQSELVEVIRNHLVEPRMELRDWDYGEDSEQFECWIVCEDWQSNNAIAYCDQGFGPTYPWGVLSLKGEQLSMGPDGGWFATFEDAARCSGMWTGDNPPNYEVQ